MSELNTQIHQKDQSPYSTVSPETLTPGKIAWRKFKRNKLAITGFIIIGLLVLGAIFAPYLTPYEWDDTNMANINAEPDSQHLLGTDSRGMDILTRLLYAGRISLSVGIFATALRVLIGVLLGGISGYYGGIIDNFIMRVADVFISFPFLPLAITMVAILGPTVFNVMLVIAVIGWPGVARIIRAEILSLKEQEFMEAANALGISDRKQILKHLLPNTMAPIIVAASLGIADAILIEAALSFLGMGVELPTPTWGNMINAAQDFYVIQYRWWQWVPPGVCIFLAVMSLNLIGDGLRDALDPRLKE